KERMIDLHKDKKLADLLLMPTKLYIKSCLAAIKTGAVHALVHVTGGGITENTPRVLPDNLSAEINLKAWDMPDVFFWLQDGTSVAKHEMLRTFNCGIGMMLVVKKEKADSVAATLSS